MASRAIAADNGHALQLQAAYDCGMVLGSAEKLFRMKLPAGDRNQSDQGRQPLVARSSS
jgi:hypothetical protein